ncbi:hypothetical protein DPMN_090750 [Dreissena polymorpha]|uniref:CCHC-type domain-containing protein n=1 Tax=Dreissena polymorpha TaxID=45954 RepID=A0A9D4KZB4_DREPO|nr:hypothetical protein DPMN_090750 [Dreissena polymorpha]
MDAVMGKLDKLLARRPTSAMSRQCFNCNEVGHFMRECPKLRSVTRDEQGNTLSSKKGEKVKFAYFNGRGSM